MKQILKTTTIISFLGISQAHAGYYDTGWYAGITAAYSNSNIDAEVGGPTAGGTFSDSYDANGGDVGLLYGYRQSFNNKLFIGGEAEFALSSASESATIAGLSVDVDKNYSYGFYLKPGFSPVDNIALFAVIGWTWSQYELEVAGVGSDKDTFNGLTFGGGAEFALTKNVRASLEYNRTDYGNNTYNYGGGDFSRFGGDANVFKTALKYHF